MCVWGVGVGVERLGRTLNDRGRRQGFIRCTTGSPRVPNSLKFSPPGKSGSANDHSPRLPRPHQLSQLNERLILDGRVWQEWQNVEWKEHRLRNA